MSGYKKHIAVSKIGVGSEVVTPRGHEVTVTSVRHRGPVVLLDGEERDSGRNHSWTEPKHDTAWVWGKTTPYKAPAPSKAAASLKKLAGVGAKAGRGRRR